MPVAEAQISESNVPNSTVCGAVAMFRSNALFEDKSQEISI